MSDAVTEQWSSRFGFLMASIGFAVGLGNIWRFPYVTGENGGGAFVLVYLLCAFGIGVPILMAELLVGRRGRRSPPGAMATVARSEGYSPRWAAVGGINLLAAFLIEVAYCVVAGWVLMYLWQALTTGFAGVEPATALAHYDAMLADISGLIGWSLLGLLCAGAIIIAGVQQGIERAVRVLMPTLFVLLIALALYNVFAGGFDAALAYLFEPDFSKINGPMILAAVGQAFFSIGVAMAGMMTFGAYLPQHISIPRSVLIIIVADTTVAMVAGLVIFPAVFNNGLDPAGGVGLIFQTLPVAFAQMPGGHIVSVLFFLLLSVAAITSMVGLIEPVNAWIEERFGVSRRLGTVLVVGAVAVLSVISTLTYNVWQDVTLFGVGLGTAINFVPNQILLPLGGLLIALFVGWRVSRATAAEELRLGATAFALWHTLLCYVVPLAVTAILVTGLLGQ